jgi:hypothetical protein
MKNDLLCAADVATLEAAVRDGHLRYSEETVTIAAKSNATGKDISTTYGRFFALDVEGMAILSNGKLDASTPKPEEGKDERSEDQKANGAADHFNYGRDLAIRQKVRAALAEQAEGPAKVIARAADQLVKAGVFETIEEATASIKASRKAKGLDA